ncbi:MAG TPA: cyanophycin synthetase, partial [Fibrobacteria bacterium]|nr:cyanophycin synthetase [Fibrobacteria bacterium]
LLALEAFLGGPIPAEALEPALRGARVPGRTQLLEAPGRRPVLLDGAHNRGGVEALARYVTSKFPGREVEALFAVMRDKDAVAVYRETRRFARTVRFVPLEDRYPRALTLAELRALLAGGGGEGGAPAGVERTEGSIDADESARTADLAALREFPRDAEEVERALDTLLREDGEGPDLVVVCGSLYLLGSLIPKLIPMYPGLAWFRQFDGEA